MATYSSQSLLGLAQGRWIEILVAAGIPAERLDGRGHSCPRCGGSDRFSAFEQLADRGAVHCRHCFTRGCDPRPGNGIATLMWFLRLRFPETVSWLGDYLGAATGSSGRVNTVYGGAFATAASKPRQVSAAHLRRMKNLTVDSMRRITLSQLRLLSDQLGVSVNSLQSLCVGYSTDHHATTWPMRDATGQIVGIRLRLADNEKRSIQSSHSGLFLLRSQRPSGDHVFIVEGASDVAAGFDLGLHCLGRPSCTGGMAQLRLYLSRHCYRSATVIADHDKNGIAGAIRLAKSLSVAGITARVSIATEQSGDLRGMLRAGAESSDVISLPIAEQFAARATSKQLLLDFAA